MQDFAFVCTLADSSTVTVLSCTEETASKTLVSMAADYARSAGGKFIHVGEDTSQCAVGSYAVKVTGSAGATRAEVLSVEPGPGWFTSGKATRRLAVFQLCGVELPLRARAALSEIAVTAAALSEARAQTLVAENKLADARDEILCLRERLETLSLDHSARLTEIANLRSENSRILGLTPRACRYGSSTGKLIETFDRHSLISRNERTQILSCRRPN